MLILALLWVVQAAQIAVNGIMGEPGENPVPTRTIIDILSESPEFSTLLHLLQTHGLIPTINTAWNATLLAPVNSAFINVDLSNIFRDNLLYLLLNDTVYLDQSHERIIAPTFYCNDGIAANVEINKDSINQGQSEIVERNLQGSPGRGIVHGITHLLDIPQDICSETFRHDDLSLFTQMASLGDACASLGADITMFIPDNHAMTEAFSRIELMYLFGGFSSNDRQDLLNRHVMRGQLNPESLPHAITMLDGSIWELTSDLNLNDTFMPIASWRCAANGMYHVYKSVLGDVVNFNPKKYILALRGYPFVRALEIYGYSQLIDGSENEEQTILVPVMTPTLKGDYHAQAEQDPTDATSITPRDLTEDDDILYQFFKPIDFNFNTNNGSGTLLESKMTLKSGRYQQRAHIYNSDSGKHYINWQQVTSEEYKIGNTTIVTIDGRLNPPPRLQMAVGPLLLSSYSLSYLERLDMLSLPTEHSWTLLLPTREAWDQAILLKYLFDANHDKLQALFNSLILSTPIYSDARGHQTAYSLDGQEVDVEVLLERGSELSTALELNGRHFDTDVTDVLFDNGVVHCTSNIVVPDSLVITASELIDAGHRSDFVKLLEVCDLDFVLNSSGNYTIIVPDPKYLAKGNYTIDTPISELEDMLKLHIIDGNPIDQLKKGETVTLLSGDPMQSQEVSNNIYSLQLLSGGGQRAFVTGWGDTNGIPGLRTTVLFIDSLISPHWIQPPILRPPFHLKTHTLLLIGIVLGLMITGLIAVGAVYIFIDEKALEAQAVGRGSRPSTRVEAEPEIDEERRPSSQPIRTTHTAPGREYGEHLDLP